MSIATSVERYADTATEFITRNRILLAVKTKKRPACASKVRAFFGLCDSCTLPYAERTDKSACPARCERRARDDTIKSVVFVPATLELAVENELHAEGRIAT